MNKTKLVAMIESSFFAGFAMILDLLPSIHLAPWVSVSFAMIPIFIIAIRWGTVVGMLSGFLWGVLQLIFDNPAMFTPFQVIIDYFIAFSFIGLAGLLRKKLLSSLKEEKSPIAFIWIFSAVFIGSSARYIWHFIAGIIFWGHFAPEGMSPAVYSFIFNGIAMIGSFLLCFLGLALLLWNAPRLIQAGQAGKENEAA